MNRAEVLKLLQSHKNQLRSLGVKSLMLFGSVAKDLANSKSDLENLLQCPIDLGTIDALKEHLRQPILEEAICVF